MLWAVMPSMKIHKLCTHISVDQIVLSFLPLSPHSLKAPLTHTFPTMSTSVNYATVLYTFAPISCSQQWHILFQEFFSV
jgi:hypothetical protein